MTHGGSYPLTTANIGGRQQVVHDDGGGGQNDAICSEGLLYVGREGGAEPVGSQAKTQAQGASSR